MRTTPPHPLVRYRHALLAIATLAWAILFFTLLKFKGNPFVPVGKIVCMAGLIFIWANGVYWWVMLRYPYIEMPPGNQFVSRDEWKGEIAACP